MEGGNGGSPRAAWRSQAGHVTDPAGFADLADLARGEGGMATVRERAWLVSSRAMPGADLRIHVASAAADALATFEARRARLFLLCLLITLGLAGVYRMLSRMHAESLRRARALNRARAQLQALNEGLDSQVQKRTAQLEQAYGDLETFSYAVAHDVRAPLASIAGFADALEPAIVESGNVKHLHYLQRIRANAAQMEELTRHLLALGRLTQAPLERDQVDLSALANEVLARLRESDPHRQVEVRIEASLLARGDRALLRQVLENLLGNAWKFSARRARAHVAMPAVTARSCSSSATTARASTANRPRACSSRSGACMAAASSPAAASDSPRCSGSSCCTVAGCGAARSRAPGRASSSRCQHELPGAVLTAQSLGAQGQVQLHPAAVIRRFDGPLHRPLQPRHAGRRQTGGPDHAGVGDPDGLAAGVIRAKLPGGLERGGDAFQQRLGALAAARAMAGEVGRPGVHLLALDVAPAPPFPGPEVQLAQTRVDPGREIGPPGLQGRGKRPAALQGRTEHRQCRGQQGGQLVGLASGVVRVHRKIAHAVADAFRHQRARMAHQPESHGAHSRRGRAPSGGRAALTG
jgi:hypothetical protein